MKILRALINIGGKIRFSYLSQLMLYAIKKNKDRMVSDIEYEVSISRERYYEIIGFSTYSYLAGKIGKYSGLFGGKRSWGEYLENFINGKLAEEAFKDFLVKNFDLEVLTDLDIADFIVSDYLPDILLKKENSEWIPLKYWVEIKEVRRDHRCFLVPTSSLKKRKYDAYVAVWVGLPDEHLSWFISNVDSISNEFSCDWNSKMNDIKDSVDNIPCKVIGFAPWEDINNIASNQNLEDLDGKYGSRGWHSYDGNTSLFDPDDDTWRGSEVGRNIGFSLNRLFQASKDIWSSLLDDIGNNVRTIPDIPLRYQTEAGNWRRHSLPKICHQFIKEDIDYRGIHQTCMEFQINSINEEKGNILKEDSWFKQPLS